jgi:hypothetical protein
MGNVDIGGKTTSSPTNAPSRDLCSFRIAGYAVQECEGTSVSRALWS